MKLAAVTEPAPATRQVRSSTVGEVGAVVIGGDHQGLGIARSLGRRGIPIVVVDDERSISRFSRYVSKTIHVSELRDEEATVDALLRIGDEHHLDGWVLYPTRDETVAALSRFRDRLIPRFRVPTPAWESIRWAWDKRNTYKLGEELSIPVPRTWYPRTLEDIDSIDVVYPVAIKPAIKEHFVYATKAKAWRADSLDELRAHFQNAARLMDPEEIIVQEMIPGDGFHQFGYCAFFRDGEAVGSMVARRLRQHPPDFGRASTYVETVDIPELEERSERFLRAINYYGLVEVEFKRDARDGEFKLLDVNARTWGYHTLGPRAGVDFPALIFLDQIGEPSEPVRAQPGVNWVRLSTDIPTGALEIYRGNLNWRDYLRSLWRANTESVFCRDDLKPALAEVALIPYLMIKRGF